MQENGRLVSKTVLKRRNRLNNRMDIWNDWAYTVKFRVANLNTYSNYCDIFKQWTNNLGVIILSQYYEKDRHDRLHVHGVLRLRHGFRRTKITKQVLFSCWLKPLCSRIDRERWFEYCMKDQDIQEQVPDVVPTKKLFDYYTKFQDIEDFCDYLESLRPDKTK